MSAARHDVLDLRPIARLRRVAAALEAHRQPAPEDRSWFLTSLRRFEASGGTSDLEQALGLNRQGVHSWWHSEARGRRDQLLLELRARHFAAISDTAAASAIIALAGRAASLTRPGRRTSSADRGPAEMMAAVLLVGVGVPKRKQMVRILRGGTFDPHPKCPFPNVPAGGA